MKRILILFLLISLLFPAIIHAESSSANQGDHVFAAARNTADTLESQYNIAFMIGPECMNATLGNFIIGNKPDGRPPLMDLLGTYNYEIELRLINDALSVYPTGFFSAFQCADFPNGLRVLLADQLIYDETTVAGITTIADGYCNIFLGVGAFNRLNIHHEIWHAMEERITAETPDIFDTWYELNPEDFLYNEDNFHLDPWTLAAPAGAYFVRGYSTVDELEDRATTFEAVFQYGREWWEEHPYIRRKLDVMLEAAEPVFGNIDNEP